MNAKCGYKSVLGWMLWELCPLLHDFHQHCYQKQSWKTTNTNLNQASSAEKDAPFVNIPCVSRLCHEAEHQGHFSTTFWFCKKLKISFLHCCWSGSFYIFCSPIIYLSVYILLKSVYHWENLSKTKKGIAITELASIILTLKTCAVPILQKDSVRYY